MRFKQVIVVTKLHPHDLRPKSRHVHHKTLREVVQCLREFRIAFRVLNRSHLKKTIQADLIITVGGDGTVLATSHYTDKTPLFAINSAPQTSTGFFCLANPQTFKRHLKTILQGKRRAILAPRLKVVIRGRPIPFPALNEFLFASRLQGDTARYRIRIGKRVEEHKSSGVWVATGAGSTGAILSAGGKIDSPQSKRLQYLVREPCRFPKKHFHLLKGFLKPGQRLTILSEMNQGMIFIDGAKLNYHVSKGTRITVRGGSQPLRIFL